MADSVTESRSHEEGRDGRSVTGMDREKNKSTTGGIVMQRVGTEVQWGMLHAYGLTECFLGHRR